MTNPKPKGTRMSTTMSTHLDERREWIERNPLRKHRTKVGLSIMAAAAATGSSMSAVQQWEAGAVTPGDEKTAAIAAFLGTEPDALTRAWQRWLKSQPVAAQ